MFVERASDAMRPPRRANLMMRMPRGAMRLICAISESSRQRYSSPYAAAAAILSAFSHIFSLFSVRADIFPFDVLVRRQLPCWRFHFFSFLAASPGASRLCCHLFCLRRHAPCPPPPLF